MYEIVKKEKKNPFIEEKFYISFVAIKIQIKYENVPINKDLNRTDFKITPSFLPL